ncbi:MAG: beta-lactamase family protein [Actinomycetia bacterium]|nr:beta-lactamase family protein [Actinomycetes bacterium]
MPTRSSLAPLVTLLALLALLAGACSTTGKADASPAPPGNAPELEGEEPGDDAASGPYFPGEEWETVDAGAAGIDRAALDAIAADAEAGLSNCFLVTRGGRIVDEWYWQDTDENSTQETFSASKSFTATLVGMAADEGYLTVEDKASTWIPEWVGTPSEDITVEQLLNNTSGRFYDFQTDYVEMAAKASDKTAFAIGLEQEHDPGTEWVYNNSAIQTLEQVFEGATGQDMADFADERLFGPLGMQDSSIDRDRAGNPLTFMGVQSTCRDMARFGIMALRDGNWDGEQVVSEEWMEASTGESSQEMNAAYGWLWWLNRPGRIMGGDNATGEDGDESAAQVKQMIEGAPEEMFFAMGLGGQMIAIDPGTETVVVRMGPATYDDDIEKFERKDIPRVVTEAVVGDMQD